MTPQAQADLMLAEDQRRRRGIGQAVLEADARDSLKDALLLGRMIDAIERLAPSHGDRA